MSTVVANPVNTIETVPFFGVTDMEASLRFYVDGLGFGVTNRWVHRGKLRWCRVERDGAALMLQEFWTDGSHAGRPAGALGTGVKVCFICRDALALYREFAGRGLKPSHPAVGNAMWVTSVTDPDGYRFDFESPTGVAEDTRYDPAVHG